MADYELVDQDGGNILGVFPSEEAALENIRQTLASPARGRVKDLALYSSGGLLAKGDRLAELATRRPRKSA